MANKTVKEVTEEINKNYRNGTPAEYVPVVFDESHRDEIRRRIYTSGFTFREQLKKVENVTVSVKKCTESSILLATKMLDFSLREGIHPRGLKNAKCDVLPDRSIFQITVGIGKLTEAAFVPALGPAIDRLDNVAYRPKLSGTALLVNLFDVAARVLTVYAFNADLVKAFDTLCSVDPVCLWFKIYLKC